MKSKSSSEEKLAVELVLEPEVGELAFVEWRDATGTSEWQTRKKAFKLQPQKCQSVGWIIAKDSDRIVLSADRWAEPKGQVGGVTAIPNDWVTQIIALELA